MAEDFCTTLAHTRSPKTSRRTTFQDELEAAVNERAVRNRVSHFNSYAFNDEDDDDDDDDVLKELLKTRRKKIDMFKVSRTKTSISDFKLSDDEEENIRPKKVSFLKSQRNSDTLTSDALRSETGRSDSIRSNALISDTLGSDTLRSDALWSESLRSDAFRTNAFRSDALISDNLRSDTPKSDTLRSNNLRSDTLRSDRSLISHQSVNKVQSRDRSHQDSEFTSHSESSAQHNSQSESPVVRKSQSESSACRRSLSESPLYSENSQWESSSEGVLEAMPPKPAPRQRAPHSAISGRDEEDGRTQTPCSRAATSPVSNTNTNTSTSTSSQTAGNSGSDARQDGVSVKANTHSRPLEGAESTDVSAAEQRKQEDYQLGSEVSPVTDSEISSTWRARSSASRPGSSRKSRSTPSYSAESRYLGTLKVLEQKSCLQETAPDTADSLRAAVYQDWLKKKEENLQATFRVKKQEEKLKEEKKTEVFEKWKREHDDLLREQLEKEVRTANRLKEKKEKEKDQRKRDSSSSFAQWSDRKKEVIEEKLKSERRKKEIKEIEEKYEKEEREKTALDMYEKWLRRKEFQQKQEQREKKMKATVVEEPPPPWSPPNRTVPFGK